MAEERNGHIRRRPTDEGAAAGPGGAGPQPGQAPYIEREFSAGGIGYGELDEGQDLPGVSTNREGYGDSEPRGGYGFGSALPWHLAKAAAELTGADVRAAVIPRGSVSQWGRAAPGMARGDEKPASGRRNGARRGPVPGKGRPGKGDA